MAVPKTKISKSRRGQRRAHDSISGSAYTECQNCGELMRSHHVCAACGFYKGREVIAQTTTETTDEVSA
jgi:large subunit ribosomal protein L32